MMKRMLPKLGTILVLLCGAIPLGAQTPVWSAGSYVYDGAGNIWKIGTETFIYDKLSRLRSGTAGTGRLQEYEYDPFGNIVKITTDQATANARRPCVDPTTNQIDGSVSGCNVTGTYDLAGNMTAYAPSATFQYDQLDMVKESMVGSRKIHLYSPSDERIASIDVTTGTQEWTLRDNAGRVLRRFQKSGSTWTWTEDYIYREGSLLAAEVNGPGRTLHFHNDHLGSPRLITGSGGAEIARHTYYPFGEEATSPNQDGERLKFTGHERDDINLDYMHARYYLPQWGRFLSVDPVWESADLGIPQSWNRYSYVRNNPVNAVDPDGRQSCEGNLMGSREHATPWETLKDLISSMIPSRENPIVLDPADQPLVTALNVVQLATLVTPIPGDEATAMGIRRTETFYRTMSQAHYEQLMATSRLPATSETFVSPSLEVARQYRGVTVQFEVAAGTTEKLLNIGVRNAVLGGSYSGLPLVQSGWAVARAFFKLEGNVVNIGLGRGAALNMFNNNLIRFLRIGQ